MARNYEGEYVKARGDKTFHLVQDGKRITLRSKEDWWECGLKRVNVLSAEEVDAIPYSHDWGEDPQKDAETDDDAEPL